MKKTQKDQKVYIIMGVVRYDVIVYHGKYGAWQHDRKVMSVHSSKEKAQKMVGELTEKYSCDNKSERRRLVYEISPCFQWHADSIADPRHEVLSFEILAQVVED